MHNFVPCASHIQEGSIGSFNWTCFFSLCLSCVCVEAEKEPGAVTWADPWLSLKIFDSQPLRSGGLV